MDPILIAAVIIVVALVAIVVIRRTRSRGPVGTERRASDPAPAAAPAGLRDRLARTRSAFGARLGSVLGREHLDTGFWQDLEESLIGADVGVATAAELVARVKRDNPTNGEEARVLLEAAMIDILAGRARSLDLRGEPAVVLVVGVNGSGKTTSIAKLAERLRLDGATVLLAAADTFRAAAAEQLQAWGAAIGVDVVTGPVRGDPAAVAFDAYSRAKAEGIDVVIVDTAGRLHSKSNLMDELGKIARVLRREAGDIDEVLLVLDGTTGQNAIPQARSFTETTGVTGLVLTKLDGTSRGGITLALEQQLDLPVLFIGVGEGADDLVPFDPRTFVEAILEP